MNSPGNHHSVRFRERSGTERGFARTAAGCILVLLVAAAVCACVETSEAPPGGNLTPARDGHPRLYFSAEELPALREKVRQEPYRSLFQSVEHQAEGAKLPSGAALTPQDLEKAATALRTNAFVYAVTGDPEAGERARRYLLEVSGWSTWQSADRVETGKLVNYGSGPLHGAIGEAYDWTYPLLNESERRIITLAMVNRSLEPARLQIQDPTATSDDCTNRIALAYGGVGIIALALQGDLPENPGMEPYTSLVHDVMIRRYLDCIDRDGGWSEGIGYLSFGLSEDAGGSGAVYYAEAVRKVTGEDLFRSTRLALVPDFLLYFLPPDRLGESGAFGDQDFSSAFRSSSAAALATRTGNPYAGWYFRNAPLSRPDPIGEILFSGDTSPVTSPDGLPASKIFRDQGWVAMRTGWNTTDTLVGFVCGPRRPGHDRPQKNGMFLDALGERLVITPGLSTQGYDDPDYRTYHAATVSQNTILVDRDPESQEWYAPKEYCTITGFLSAPFYDQVQGDATEAYRGTLNRFRRDLVFVKPSPPGFVVIHDEVVASGRPRSFQFLLHALGEDSISVDSGVPGRATITRDGATLQVAVISPEKVMMAVREGAPTSFQDTNHPTSFLEISTETRVPQARFLVVLFPVAAGEDPPLITPIHDPGMVGAAITRGGITDLVVFRTGPEGIATAGIVTDGRNTWVHLEDGRITRYALGEGSTLSFHGTVLYRSPTVTSVTAAV